jgi:signal transduction histidine kinase
LSGASALLAEVDQRVSNLALDLRPAMLDDLGLLPTVRWYVNRYTRRTGIAVALEIVDFEESQSQEVTTTVYRVIQEALTNVARHAAATQVTVQLSGSAATLTLVIQDNGRGFEPDSVDDTPFSGRGAGLLGIQERVAMLRGTCHIQSRPGQGARLMIDIPLQD